MTIDKIISVKIIRRLGDRRYWGETTSEEHNTGLVVESFEQLKIGNSYRFNGCVQLHGFWRDEPIDNSNYTTPWDYYVWDILDEQESE